MDKEFKARSMADEAPAKLQSFQRDYAAYLRSPTQRRRPAGIPHAPSAVYESLLINNVRGFLNSCFPVIRSIFPTARWHRLSRCFFRDWSAQSPLFSEVAKEFVLYLHSEKAPDFIPPWLAELAHYEWVELLADTHPGTVPAVSHEFSSGQTLTVNPTLQILNYHWPVHTISPANKRPKAAATHLLVFRSGNHKVHFIETNAVTNALLEIIADTPNTSPLTLQKALEELAPLLGQNNAQQLLGFAQPMVQNLLSQQVLFAAEP